MPTALVLSPHLDDAAFSCGGTMALLADAGWRVCLVTAFTRSIHPASGFALACQLDKGLSPDIDYMAVRRAEDQVAADILGVADLRWLGLPEAPHRGYDLAPDLFGAVHADDDIWRMLAGMIDDAIDELEPALVLAPQGLGNHVDHQQMIHALAHAAPQAPTAYYRDTPYAIANTMALPSVAIRTFDVTHVDIVAGLDRKVRASCAYLTQLGFQFGGPVAAGDALRDFAQREARDGLGRASERFLGHMPLP